MRKVFKKTFQPLEIALKKALGIKKVCKGQILDSSGFVCNEREKITRFVLFIPLFQKIRTLISVSEFNNGAIASNGGGPQEPKSILLSIKTHYKIVGILVFFKTTTSLHNSYSRDFALHATVGNGDFCNIGKYIATNPNIKNEIFALIKDLDSTSKALALRQIALAFKAYKTNNPLVNETSTDEIIELAKIKAEFHPLKLCENLYTYNGYFLPINHFEVGVFWHKHSLSVLEPNTLAKMRGKDFIDVGAYIGDSAIIFEREFCDKNIYCFEPTSANFANLKETLRLNDSKRIIPINLGLGAKEAKYEVNIAGSGSSIAFDYYGTESESVEITTLDKFIAEHGIKVGFIKVDIEGFEMEFLKGAKETICTQKPAMLLSIYHQPSDYFGIKPLIESWNLGYSFKIHKGIDFSLTSETALFCEIVE